MRTLARSGVLAAVFLAPAACGGPGGGGEALPEAGEIIKISYFRANPDPQTKKLLPTYKVAMSNSWKDRIGESPRDPIERAAPGQVFKGFFTDAEMARHLAFLRSKGLERLPAVNTEDFKPEELHRLALDPKDTSFMRVITVATDQWQRSYVYKSVHAKGSEHLIPVFTTCEAIASRIVDQTIRTKTYTDRTAIPRDR